MRISTIRMITAAAMLVVSVGSFGMFAPAANAEPTTHVVEAKGVKFDPLFIYIEPGDSVSFERMPSHNVETLTDMVPEGQEQIETELGENFVQTFEVEGIIAYKCTPHWGNRMGGFIIVGQPEDPGAIIDRYMALTEEVKEYLPARGLLKKLRADMEERGMIEGTSS